MITLILEGLLATAVYYAVAIGIKIYYKLHRWDNVLTEEPYIVGALWPIYIAYRLITLPYVHLSAMLEIKIAEAKKKPKEIKTRVASNDRILLEAEREVEEMLEERYTSL